MNSEKKLKRWLTISLITIFSISFLTIRGETNKINDEIISLKIRKKIIEDNKINLLSKRNRLMSQSRIEGIARDSLGMKKQKIINKNLTLNIK
tara:strand:+ start:246 stop:524 length:279 start_codon:yes stop_codon:yes gene_type:complete